MSFRPPRSLTHDATSSAPIDALQYELLAERADSLGRAGRKAEEALERLKQASEQNREACLNAAANAVYALFIQREVCGLRNGRDVIARYGVPGQVLARLGTVRR